MLLTMRDKQRVDVITAVMDGRIGISEAGKVLERSVRQIYRMLEKVRKRGIQGVIHGNRGKESPRKTREDIRDRILTLVQGSTRIPTIPTSRSFFSREKVLRSGERPCGGSYGKRRFHPSGSGGSQSIGSDVSVRRPLG